MSGVAEWFGLKLVTLMAGLARALISLKIIEGQTLPQRTTTVVAGALVAAYCTPLSIDLLLYFGVFATAPSGRTEGAIAFLGGLFGMALVGALMKAIPEWIEAARAKFLGGRA